MDGGLPAKASISAYNGVMLNLNVIFPLLAFAFVTCASPGPNNVMLMSSGVNFGFKRSLPHILGVLFGFPVMIVLVGLGLIRVFEIVEHSFTVLKVLSFAYLIYLAWRIANTKTLSSGKSSSEPLTLLQAALFQWVNPKAWTMALTAITVYTPHTTPLFSVFIVASAFVLSGFFSTCFWTLTGQQLKRFLNDPVKLRVVNLILAVLLILTLLPILIYGNGLGA